MDDTNQIEVPPSFLVLYTTRSGDRLTKPAEFVCARYELCEDLAQTLAQQAAATLFKSGGTEQEVLEKMREALLEPGSAVSPAEGGWVVTRMAEIAGWC
jgi:hypothetical protein